VLLVLTIPLVIFLHRDSATPPVIGPTTPPPTVSPSPTLSPPAGLSPQPRKLAGHTAPFTGLPTLYFAGSNNIWALYESCVSTVDLKLVCEYALDFSGDRGRTWAAVKLPDVGGASIHAYFVDERTFTIQRPEP